MRRYRLPQAMMLTPAALAAPLLTVLGPGRRQYRDGLPAALVEWFRELEQLADEQPTGRPSAPVEWITADRAAMLLGLSIRQTTSMASRMGGRKVGGRWMLNAHVVVEEAEARSAAVGGRDLTVVA